jgi:hypothetical protein
VFRGRHWGDVRLVDLARYSATLSFLTPEAYRFYLPAYLLAVIRLSPELLEQVPRAGDVEESLLFSLIANRFVHVDQREGGWPKLYQDPTDGSYWELAYPHTQMYRGGPPVLTRLSVEHVQSLYRLPALERHAS